MLLLGIEKKANQNKAIQLVILNLELNNDAVKRFAKKLRATENIREKVYSHRIDLVRNFFKELDSINDVYYLPASRSGLYQALNAFGAIFAELAKNRSFTSKPISIPAISEPVADYFLHLSNITSRKSNHDLQSYIEEIEKEILQGSVEFNSETKHLLFTLSNLPLVLDLSVTSSMVSEISPIVAYLKYILSTNKKQKPLIFIEEPEAHLHPENQVKLMAVFARLVKDNKIKLVATSHSNYIFNKASNLVIDNKIDRGKFVAVLFANTSEGSETRALETDEYGIEDDNFIDTAESLYTEKMALFDKLNAQ
ncbi:AAA family ATPase [Beggiatoa leptomitoformis]|uniref:AAA family ATPase n=1 Tax=Beggiatoa leptomitoformis TaxID=288004 RepID=UPI000706017D|nr:AAA family ATPase [Beggiatoa leptomitoformis]